VRCPHVIGRVSWDRGGRLSAVHCNSPQEFGGRNPNRKGPSPGKTTERPQDVVIVVVVGVVAVVLVVVVAGVVAVTVAVAVVVVVVVVASCCCRCSCSCCWRCRAN
jgi:Flp pilus assembly protein TadB